MTLTEEMKLARKKGLPGADMKNITPDSRFPATVTINGMEYAHIPASALGRAKGLYIAMEKFDRVDGVNWYQAKWRAQELGGRLPTNLEWSRSVRYAQANIHDLEEDMIIGPKEWVDLLINFSSCYRNETPPLAIEETVVAGEKDSVNNAYKLIGGTVKQLPWLPREDGYIREWDEEEELPSRVGCDADDKFKGAQFEVFSRSHQEVLRAVERGECFQHPGKPNPAAHFSVGASCTPWTERLGGSFRVVIDEDKVKGLV